MNTGMLVSGDARRKKLDSIQSHRKALIVDRERVLKAPLPQNEYTDAVRSSLAREMERGVAARARHMRFSGRKPEGMVAPSLGSDEPLTLADMAWLIGLDEVVGKIVAGVGDEIFEGAVESDLRKRQLSEIDGKIEEAEALEEREVLRLQAEGLLVRRRETANPRILLQVWMEGFEVANSSPRDVPEPVLSAWDRQHATRIDIPLIPPIEAPAPSEGDKA